MERHYSFILCASLLFLTGYTQTIQYSKSAFRNPYFPQMQLVADVGGYHHLLFFSAETKPLIYVFNPQMQLVTKKELNTRVRENYDIRVVPLGNEYLLYLHTPSKALHEMFRIKDSGTIINVSETISKVLDSLSVKTTATFQIQCQENKLYFLK